MALLTLTILFNSFFSYLEYFSILQSDSYMVGNDSGNTDFHLGLIRFTCTELLVLGKSYPIWKQ